MYLCNSPSQAFPGQVVAAFYVTFQQNVCLDGDQLWDLCLAARKFLPWRSTLSLNLCFVARPVLALFHLLLKTLCCDPPMSIRQQLQRCGSHLVPATPSFCFALPVSGERRFPQGWTAVRPPDRGFSRSDSAPTRDRPPGHYRRIAFKTGPHAEEP